MRRLRLALLALVIAVAIPVALLVDRALESAAFERHARQAAVADRVIDEMERALSELLAREERRPATAYQFYVGLDASGSAPAQGGVRSTLSRPSPEPFVVAHYQLGPDGRVTSPLEPDDRRRARAAGDWPPGPGDAERIERAQVEIDQIVEPFWRSARTPGFEDALARDAGEARSNDLAEAIVEAEQAGAREGFAAGTEPGDDDARAPARAKAARKPVTMASPAAEEAAPDGRKDEASSAYEALQSFNRGAALRKERKSVVQVQPRFQVYEDVEGAGSPERPKSPDVVGRRFAPPVPRVARAVPSPKLRSELESEVDALADPDASAASEPPRIAAPEAERRYPDEMARGLGRAEAQPTRGARQHARSSGRAVRRTDTRDDVGVRIILDPMRGVILTPDRLLLYRTVLVDGVGYRQGLLIDTLALGRWLSDTVIAPARLADLIEVRFGADAAVDPEPGTLVSRHEFAEPFAGFAAVVRVAPIAGSGDVAIIYTLVGLLAVVLLVGLLAVDRMASVVIEFAERRGNFVAAVSHELKTPLTAIRMHAEMLRDGMATSEAKRNEYYSTITSESERLSRLIDNVLEFSRLERGDRTFSLCVGSLGDAVEEAAEKLAPHVARAGFELDVEVQAGLPTVRFDPDALTQMIFNLVDNAMKYASQAEPRRVVLRCTMEEPGSPRLTVRDFGPGVPRRQLKRIFEPFYRVEAELTRSAKGSGIGLALVKDLAEAMGAKVSALNLDEGGFAVVLEFAAADANG